MTRRIVTSRIGRPRYRRDLPFGVAAARTLWAGDYTKICRACGLCIGLLLLVSGCVTYQLQGTVVDGRDPAVRINQPAILVVDKNDPRLNTTGLASATVSATLDPDSMNPKYAGQTSTDARGRFALPVEHGAGMLIYSAQILARRDQHQTAETFINLPGKNKRLLIVLPYGQDNWRPKKDFVEETIEMGKPYTDGGL